MRKRTLIFCSILYVLAFTFCDELTAGEFSNLEYKRINLPMLLSRPSEFNGQRVIITGWFCDLGLDGEGIFLTKDDCVNENYENAIQLNLSKDDKSEIISHSESASLITLHGQFESWQGRVALDTVFIWGILSIEKVELF